MNTNIICLFVILYIATSIHATEVNDVMVAYDKILEHARQMEKEIITKAQEEAKEILSNAREEADRLQSQASNAYIQAKAHMYVPTHSYH